MLNEEAEFHLCPVSFLALSANCYYKDTQNPEWLSPLHQLDNTSDLTGEESFAQVAVGWNEEGLAFEVQVHKVFEKALFPEVQRGDSVELFIDTRDLKTAGFNTRFCHHFFFFAKPVDDKQCGEITRFRTEDVHEWCDAKELRLRPHFTPSGYSLEIFIPSHCLHGYAPGQFNRLGFTYRINRLLGSPQHFSVVSSDYQIDQQPSLWSSLKFVQ